MGKKQKFEVSTHKMLEEATKQELNGLPCDNAYQSENESFFHELIWYGIDAVAHTHLMRKASEQVVSGKIQVEDFMRMYGLSFKGKDEGIEGNLRAIEKDGIFIPAIKYDFHDSYRKGEQIFYFEGDYRNLFVFLWDAKRGGYVDLDDRFILQARENAQKVIGADMRWVPSLLADKETVEAGMQLGKDMWVISVSTYRCAITKSPLPEKITELGEKLIEYYENTVTIPWTSNKKKPTKS